MHGTTAPPGRVGDHPSDGTAGGEAPRSDAGPPGAEDPDAVRDALMSHEAVADAHLVPVRCADGVECLDAYVVLKKGYPPGEDLKGELSWHVMARLSRFVPFRAIRFRVGLEMLRDASPAGFDLEGDEIRISGWVVNTATVERAFRSRPEVADARVFCVPDAMRGALLEVYIALNEGYAPSDQLRDRLAMYARIDLGPITLFKDIRFVMAGNGRERGGRGAERGGEGGLADPADVRAV